MYLKKQDFRKAALETGLSESSAERLDSRLQKLFPENKDILTAYAYVLQNTDPDCLTELTHCIDVATDTSYLGQAALSEPNHSKTFGFSAAKQEELDASVLAALFHDIALGYDRDELKRITGNTLLHRWDKNNGVHEDTDSYRGALLLEREVGDKLGLPDKTVDNAITILKSHGMLEHPWQGLVEFGDALAYINGDNHSRAVLECYLLGDHVDSFRKGLLDESTMEKEIDFWKDIGLIEFGSGLGTTITWNHTTAQNKMLKKGFTLLGYVRQEMPGTYNTVKDQAENKKRFGFIAPDVWAMRNYHAALDVLRDTDGLPPALAAKMTEAHALASKYGAFYGGA
jgi:hypothetical protein